MVPQQFTACLIFSQVIQSHLDMSCHSLREILFCHSESEKASTSIVIAASSFVVACLDGNVLSPNFI